MTICDDGAARARRSMLPAPPRPVDMKPLSDVCGQPEEKKGRWTGMVDRMAGMEQERWSGFGVEERGDSDPFEFRVDVWAKHGTRATTAGFIPRASRPATIHGRGIDSDNITTRAERLPASKPPCPSIHDSRSTAQRSRGQRSRKQQPITLRNGNTLQSAAVSRRQASGCACWWYGRLASGGRADGARQGGYDACGLRLSCARVVRRWPCRCGCSCGLCATGCDRCALAHPARTTGASAMQNPSRPLPLEQRVCAVIRYENSAQRLF